MRRVILIVLDSVGIGATPDAHKYGDTGSNTLANIAKKLRGLSIPNMESLGLGNIAPIQGVAVVTKPKAFYGKMAEASNAKDTTVGHWEIAGVITEKPFPTYPKGFPTEIIEPFKTAINRDILGNKTASGTEILKEYGDEQIRTGSPIIYTSIDSVFQIAACEETIPVETLYNICEKARAILTGKNNVGRVIARPFIKKNGGFLRTERRRDFSIEPPYPTLLDLAVKKKLPVIGIGKIGDLFAHRGLTEEIHIANNTDGIKKTIASIKEESSGIIFTNLVDFDTKFGHRNDTEGYADALKNFDSYLPEIIEALQKDDILIITADHGCDPTTSGTDHTREFVPILVYGRNLGTPGNLGVRSTFADIGASIVEYLNLDNVLSGKSFWKDICKTKKHTLNLNSNY